VLFTLQAESRHREAGGASLHAVGIERTPLFVGRLYPTASFAGRNGTVIGGERWARHALFLLCALEIHEFLRVVEDDEMSPIVFLVKSLIARDPT